MICICFHFSVLWQLHNNKNISKVFSSVDGLFFGCWFRLIFIFILIFFRLAVLIFWNWFQLVFFLFFSPLTLTLAILKWRVLVFQSNVLLEGSFWSICLITLGKWTFKIPVNHFDCSPITFWFIAATFRTFQISFLFLA
jgi:hypothetical protein